MRLPGVLFDVDRNVCHIHVVKEQCQNIIAGSLGQFGGQYTAALIPHIIPCHGFGGIGIHGTVFAAEDVVNQDLLVAVFDLLRGVQQDLYIITLAEGADEAFLIQDGPIDPAGVGPEGTDPQIISAVVAYAKWQFGNNEDADRWRDIYHIKLGQLKTMTGFTDWNTEA